MPVTVQKINYFIQRGVVPAEAAIDGTFRDDTFRPSHQEKLGLQPDEWIAIPAGDAYAMCSPLMLASVTDFAWLSQKYPDEEFLTILRTRGDDMVYVKAELAAVTYYHPEKDRGWTVCDTSPVAVPQTPE